MTALPIVFSFLMAYCTNFISHYTCHVGAKVAIFGCGGKCAQGSNPYAICTNHPISKPGHSCLMLAIRIELMDMVEVTLM